jgi:predicted phosphodiesterase
MIRLAAISDIHGNAGALRAVLTDVDRLGVDAVVVCGDLVVYGPEPLEVLELLQARRDVICIQGNTDRYLVERRVFDVAGKEPWQRELLDVFPWTAERIGAEGVFLLLSLPAHLHIPLKGGGEILFVHGSPRSDEEGIHAAGDETGLATVIARMEVSLLVCGHTHRPFSGRVGNTPVLNLGSVGLPFDGTPWACYALIEVEGEHTRVALRRVEYEVEKAVCLVRKLSMPGAEVTVWNLQQARAMGGNNLIYQGSVEMAA